MMRKNYTRKQHRNNKKQKIKNTGKFGKGNNTDIMLKCRLSVGIIKRKCEKFVEGLKIWVKNKHYLCFLENL